MVDDCLGWDVSRTAGVSENGIIRVASHTRYKMTDRVLEHSVPRSRSRSVFGALYDALHERVFSFVVRESPGSAVLRMFEGGVPCSLRAIIRFF